jgi:hypothetical protein
VTYIGVRRQQAASGSGTSADWGLGRLPLYCEGCRPARKNEQARRRAADRPTRADVDRYVTAKKGDAAPERPSPGTG